jgi:hypothetical protein
MKRLVQVALLMIGAGCEQHQKLSVLEWASSVDGPGFVEAVFLDSTSVFREPFLENRSDIGFVVVSDAQGREAVGWMSQLQPPSNEGADVQVLSPTRFRLTFERPRVPLNSAGTLQIAVRAGELAVPGWPTFVGEVEFGAPTVE